MFEITQISQYESTILAEIHKKCFSEGWSEESFRDMLTNKFFFGFICHAATNSEKVFCGFILCKKIFDEIEIITICVIPKFRQHGVGRSLISEVIKNISNLMRSESMQKPVLPKIFLEVAKNNPAAINLYRSLGFEKISERANYYVTPDGAVDAIVMTLELYMTQ